MESRNEIAKVTRELLLRKESDRQLLKIVVNPRFTIEQHFLIPDNSGYSDRIDFCSIQTEYSIKDRDLCRSRITLEINSFLDTLFEYKISIKRKNAVLSYQSVDINHYVELERPNATIEFSLDGSDNIRRLEADGQRLSIKPTLEVFDPRQWLVQLSNCTFELLHPTIVLSQIAAGKLPFGIIIDREIELPFKKEG